MDYKIAEFRPEDLEEFACRIKGTYYEQGAFIVRNLFNDEDIAPPLLFLDKCVSLLERKEGLFDQINKIDQYSLTARIRALMSIDPGYQSIIYDSISQSPEMHACASSQKTINVIQAIFGKNIMLNPRLVLIMSLPRESWHLARWHQDYFYNWGPKDSCTLYAPLQKTNQSNGGLRLAIGSHLQGELPHVDEEGGSDRSKWKSICGDYIDNMSNVVDVNLEKGDALFFHSLIAHSPRVNKSSSARFVLNFRYQNMNDINFVQNGWRIAYNKEAREALSRKNETTS